MKPGHWASAYQDYKRPDKISAAHSSLTPVLKGEGSLALPDSDYGFRFVRPAALAKGQQKRLDLRFFVPQVATESRNAIGLVSQFDSRQGLSFQTGNTNLRSMGSQEYYFVILTTRPTEFSSLSAGDWKGMRSDDLPSDQDLSTHYRIVIPETDGVIPIPDSFMSWTSIAYVLWDDLSPEALTADQQQALLDWVHWGGRMIVNGPASVPDFRGTSLEPLLPVEPSQSEELTGKEVAGMVQQWGVPASKKQPIEDSTSTVVTNLQNVDSMIGSKGSLKSGARSVAGTDELVAEWGVGRGNVVTTRFDLTAGWIRKWASASGFYNGALLRRPPRDYLKQDFGHRAIFDSVPENAVRDPRLVSGLRISSRNLGRYVPVEDESEEESKALSSPWLDNQFESTPLGGVGGWNDNSGVCALGKSILQDEAGISIPSSQFVATSLLWYLAVLVPLNYLIFRIINRLEWAWIAVPLIATGGAVWIAKSAQLDIGFARSRNEIAVLELQPGYARGHLTRMFALYNSLSTTYDIGFDSRDAVAAPMAQGAAMANAATQFIDYRHGFSRGIELQGMNVRSNKTALLHTEQIVPLEGGISLSADGTQLSNQSELVLEDVMLVRRNDLGQVQFSPQGAIGAGEVIDIEFASKREWDFSEDVTKDTRQLMEFFLAEQRMRPGDARLIARIPESMPGITITPEASQGSAETVVIAGLSYRPLPEAKPDLMLRPKLPDDGEDFSEELEKEKAETP